jgi:hypothetical protein
MTDRIKHRLQRLFGFGQLSEVELLALTNRDDLTLIINRRLDVERYDMLRDGDRYTAETFEQLGEIRRINSADLKAEGQHKRWLR